MNKTPRIAFFGTPDRATIALDAMRRAGIVPALVITQPDRPQGRKFILTPPPVKIWATNEGISTIQPDDLSDPSFLDALRSGDFDVFVVVAYGKIMKKELLSIPRFGSINLHGSLLPKLRGASPIESAILADERETGATIILMDELMDHGPILMIEKTPTPAWPLPADDLARIICKKGGELLAKTVRALVDGTAKPVEQDHAQATYTKKISKADGEIDPGADAYQNWLKFNAYKGWPGTYYFLEHNGKKTRISITDAVYENGAFVIKKIVPEGKKEIAWNPSFAPSSTAGL